MIPVVFPSARFLLILAISFGACVALLAWLALLAASAAARRRWRRRPKLGLSVFAGLGLVGWIYPWVQYNYWRIEHESAQRQAALHVTLDRLTRLGGVDMPAGTHLQLYQLGQPDSFVRAEFPQPTPAYGMQALVLERSVVDLDAGQGDARPRYAPDTVKVRGVGTLEIQGWHCDATAPVSFAVAADASIRHVDTCVLAAGQRLAELGLPAGTTLRWNGGTVYADGARDDDDWRLELPADGVVELAGLPLRHPVLAVDRQGRLLGFHDAVLARAIERGALQYPAETAVTSAPRGWREKYPGALVFTAPGGRNIPYQGHGDVAEGYSVLQGPAADVLAVLPNEQLGVATYPKIVVEPDRLP